MIGNRFKLKMDKIFEILTDINEEGEDVRELWDEIFRYSNENKDSAHNLIIGVPQKGDTVLWQELINKEGKTMGFAEHTVCYQPATTTHMSRTVITAIAIIDIKNDKFGGNAQVESGGVGYESVIIRLRANFWRRMSFQVIVIGKYL